MGPDNPRDGESRDGRTVEPGDARAALDDIRRRQEQSGMAELRHGLSPFYLTWAALLLFASFASFDLPNPWGGAVLFPGIVLVAVMVFAYLRRAPVRNKPSSGATLIAVACGLALVGVFRVLAGAFEAGGAPAPHVIASAIVVGVCLLLVPYGRRIAETRLRSGTGSG
ncbi:hypothetical protein [Streptomyces fuscigenes]|uniref:hypothetical protein n=1 Tax=Streptomyces fuscigenes TaxID=1528880 RepID=UPI001F2667D0|nr:hypothetical protein [Streptomyces fuscigenes]MCF3964313.1 hypothetical protein [Streptomyces fuscigenes]